MTKTPSGMRSGQLAAAAGVSADTLRHYENEGLLEPPRRLPNGYRVYPPDALRVVLLIQRGLAIGFGLSELGVFLRARQTGAPPCKRVHALASQRLAELERQIERLSLFRDEFRGILEDWAGRLAGTPEGSPARLLETLSALPFAGESGALRGMKFTRKRKKEKS